MVDIVIAKIRWSSRKSRSVNIFLAAGFETSEISPVPKTSRNPGGNINLAHIFSENWCRWCHLTAYSTPQAPHRDPKEDQKAPKGSQSTQRSPPRKILGSKKARHNCGKIVSCFLRPQLFFLGGSFGCFAVPRVPFSPLWSPCVVPWGSSRPLNGIAWHYLL